MRKCTFCGREYPDGALRCLVDEYPLIGGEAPPPLATDATPIINVPPEIGESAAPKITSAERLNRTFELALVCAIAFGGSLLTSLYYLFHPLSRGSHAGLYSWIQGSMHELVTLALLWYVLRRRAQSFRDLGLRWRIGDIGISILLAFAAYGAYIVTWYFTYYAGLGHGPRTQTTEGVSEHVFGGGVSVLALLFQFLNPFYEELAVRAFVMTEVKWLTGSVWLAIAISTALQASYHLYQGLPLAISDGAAFFIFSLYYAKTGRITPVILAHLYQDVYASLHYWLRHI